MCMKQTRIYFPNLDGLRFIAFFLVFFNHVFYLTNTGIPEDSFWFAFLQNLEKNGALGVNLFFVLSGFLITFLLLNEQKTYGKIHIGQFYMRRLLRIWPLYFLMVLLGFFLFPIIKTLLGESPMETHQVLFYLFFISNFHMLNAGWPDSSILSVLWSVGIEEQFYLLWPVLLFIVPTKRLPILFGSLIFFTLLFRYINWAKPLVLYFHTLSVIGDMVVGGISALLVFKSGKFKEALEKMPGLTIKLVYFLGTTVILFNYIIFSGALLIAMERFFISLFFAFVILEQNFAKYSFYKFSENKFLSRWGNYTYGLYCWQMPAFLVTHFINLHVLSIKNGWLDMAVSFVITLPFTMLLAYVSYHKMEKPFLKLKHRFSFITR